MPPHPELDASEHKDTVKCFSLFQGRHFSQVSKKRQCTSSSLSSSDTEIGFCLLKHWLMLALTWRTYYFAAGTAKENEIAFPANL